MTTAPPALPRQPLLTREDLGVPGERERYRIKRDITLSKINTLLLPAMRAHDIDMWIVLDREYHPDPLSGDIGGEAGVRNAAIFYDTGSQLEKIYIFSHPAREDLVSLLYDQLIHYAYRPEGLRPHLARVVAERSPRRIALNMSPTLPMADGLTAELKGTWTLQSAPSWPRVRSRTCVQASSATRSGSRRPAGPPLARATPSATPWNPLTPAALRLASTATRSALLSTTSAPAPARTTPMRSATASAIPWPKTTGTRSSSTSAPRYPSGTGRRPSARSRRPLCSPMRDPQFLAPRQSGWILIPSE